MLLDTVANVNRCVKDGGFLVVGDFASEAFLKRKYGHLPEEDVYTYKQTYHCIFSASGTYSEIAKFKYDRPSGRMTTDLDLENFGCLTLLKKEPQYIEVR